MMIRKEDMYTLLVNQEELDIIADSVSSTNQLLEEAEEATYDQQIKKGKEMLKTIKPWAKVLVCIGDDER